MRILGVIGIVSGGLMVVVGAVCLGRIGTIGLTPLLIGIIAALCGSICVALAGVQARLDELASKLSETELLLRSNQPSAAEAAAEHVVVQLRREGLIRAASSASDEDISEMMD